MTYHLPLLANIACAFYMTGVIWVIQVVHYPLMARVGSDQAAAYARSHVDRMGGIAGPAMILELLSAIALLWFRPAILPAWWAWTGLALVLVTWVVTFACSVPQHRVLVQRFDDKAHNFLVSTNWIRTGTWTGRAVLSVWALQKLLAEIPSV